MSNQATNQKTVKNVHPLRAPQVYVIMPVHNRRNITKSILEDFKKQTYEKFKVILVDDGSKDGTAEMAYKTLPGIIVLKGKGSWWWSGSLQKGIDFVNQLNPNEDDVILFVNDDQQVEPDFLEKSIHEFYGQLGTFMLAPGFSYESREPLVHERGIKVSLEQLTFHPTEVAEEVNCCSTRALFMHWKDLKKVGGFKPKLLPHYLSDYEFTIRAHSLGIKLIIGNSSRIFIREKETGFRDLKHITSFRKRMSYALSERFPSNPIRFSIFILMMTPRNRWGRHLFRTWKGFCGTLIK